MRAARWVAEEICNYGPAHGGRERPCRECVNLGAHIASSLAEVGRRMTAREARIEGHAAGYRDGIDRLARELTALRAQTEALDLPAGAALGPRTAAAHAGQIKGLRQAEALAERVAATLTQEDARVV